MNLQRRHGNSNKKGRKKLGEYLRRKSGSCILKIEEVDDGAVLLYSVVK